MKKILIFALTLVFQYGLVGQNKSTTASKKSELLKDSTLITTKPSTNTTISGSISNLIRDVDITIIVKGLEKGKNAYLGYYFGDKQYLIDTVQVQDNGVVRFKRAKKLHGGMYLFVTHDIQYFEFIIDSVQKFTLKTDTSLGMVGNMQVIGSKENERFFSYLKTMENFRKDAEILKVKLDQSSGREKELLKKQIEILDNKIKLYQINFKSERPGELFVKMLNGNEDVDMSKFPIKADGSYDTLAQFYYYKSHYWDKVDFRDERLLYTPIYHKKMSRYFEDLVFQTPDSIIPETDWFIGEIGTQPDLFKYTVHYLTNKYEKSEIMGMDRVFVHLGKKYYLTGRATWMDDTAMAKFKDRITTLEYNLIGINGMELNLPDSSEKLRSLYAVKAPITILVFWNPDCGHCQKEIPMLYKLWNGIKDNGVAVYAVNTEFDKNLWTKFIREKGLNGWTNVHDIKVTHNFRKWYDVYSTPVVYLMDADKKILAKRIAVEQIEGYLKNYYSKELKRNWKDSGLDFNKLIPDNQPIEIAKNEPEIIPNTAIEWKGNGSGFFINEKGYIATNYHVIKDAQMIQVEYFQSGEKYIFEASVITVDRNNDLAILKINDTKFNKLSKEIPYNFNTKIQDVGKSVFALGYPIASVMGNEIKFTDGKISSKTGIKGDVTVYQITVPIQPGNSGGPLFDELGNLIGITSSQLNKEIFDTENVNYAIKSTYLKNLVEVMEDKISLPKNTDIYNINPVSEKIKILKEFVILIRVK